MIWRGPVIVFTLPDGLVSLVIPSGEFMAGACNGGGLLVTAIDIDVERRIAAGFPADAARRHAKAAAFGGCTSAEALAVVRDSASGPDGLLLARDAFAPELMTPSSAPDRWFRNAWRRDRKGGPIWIDIDQARRIQREKIKTAIRQWNKRATEEDEDASLARLTNGPALIEWDWPLYRARLLQLATPRALKAVWPQELPRVN